MPLTPGTVLGRYEIRSKLGEGGMGEVYLARDTKLERTVALKILPDAVVADHQRMNRFIQEAKSVSALNHPNIITIHEVEDSEAVYFIATEFIDGETLRHRLTQSQFSVQEALEIAMQVASALAAAHEAQIMHRDIKPDNIMIRRRDGIVKVLDFGLAKLTGPGASSVDSEAATRALVNTAPGTVMGTATYMSPEQARGLEVDERTDIWSLGVVLFEMLSRQPPFGGTTATDVIASILKSQPATLSQVAPHVPAKLEEIVSKALEKDREDRYQTIKDLLVDLRKLKRRVDAEAEMERSVAPELASTTGLSAVRDSTGSTIRQSGDPTTSVVAARPTSSAEYLVGEIKRHKTVAFIGGAIFVAMILIVAGLLLRNRTAAVQSQQPGSPAGQAPSSAMKLSRLTTHGKASLAAISPDGRYVIHVLDEDGRQSLWVRQVATGSSQQIIAPKEISFRGLTFSPDGDYIFYVMRDREYPVGAVFQLPVLGGAEKRVLTDVDTPVSFSPDGQYLAFGRDQGTESTTVVMRADGTDERVLSRREGKDWYTSRPAWSPDGKRIAIGAGSTAEGKQGATIITIDIESGKETPVTRQKWAEVADPVWLADGSAIVFGAQDQSTFFNQIWRASYPAGESRRVTNDFNNYHSLDIARSSNVLVAVQNNSISNVWIASASDLNRATQITSGNSDGISSLAWTPDRKIVYTSSANGSLDLWIMNSDGSNPKQLTNDTYLDYTPVVTSDGRYIVFVSHRSGAPCLWRIDIDGSNAKQLTNGGDEFNPQVTPDGQWVIYDTWTSGSASLRKLSISGGEPTAVSDKFLMEVSISPDGKQLAAWYVENKVGAPRQVAIVPIDGSTILKTFSLAPTVQIDNGVHWQPDGRALLYFDNRGTSWNIWSQSVAGGDPVPLTNFKSGGVSRIVWSRDGKQAAMAQGSETNDVVMFSDF